MSKDFPVEMTVELKAEILLNFLDLCSEFGGFVSEFGEALERFTEAVENLEKEQIQHILGHFVEGIHNSIEKWGKHLTAVSFSVGKFNPDEVRERVMNDPDLTEEEREHVLQHLEESLKIPDED